MKKELWLEFGSKHTDGWQDVYWYNEGRWQESPYWLKAFLKRLLRRTPKHKMYFKLRYGRKGFTTVI